MTVSDKLNFLKCDLQMTTAANDEYLKKLLEVAEKAVNDEGITLDASSIQDNYLIVMYAAYLYRKRATNDGMSRMLRFALNNRKVKEIGGANNGIR